MKLIARLRKTSRKTAPVSITRAALSLIFLVAPALRAAPQFTVSKTTEDGITVIHLKDSARGMEAEIVPAFGNRAIALRIHGKNILYFPQKRLQDFAAKPTLNGVPFLAPWANRLGGSSYWANGKE